MLLFIPLSGSCQFFGQIDPGAFQGVALFPWLVPVLTFGPPVPAVAAFHW